MNGAGARLARTLIPVAAIVLLAATRAEPIAAQGQTHRIDMKSVAFIPARVSVRVGDTIEWENSDVVAHTATSKDGGFDVNVLPHRKGSTVVRRPGTFSYICRYHPNMKGEVVVQP